MKSNCLLEAVKAKLFNPRQNKIYKRGSWACIFKRQWPHFYWYHKPHDKYYHYCQKDALSWLNQLWYKGDIVEFTWHNDTGGET
jgi:hypothetical protein